MANARTRNSDSAANLGFEAKLWAAADALRNNMDAAEYKHVVLGLIFLKYVSDAFEARHAELAAQKAHCADHEDPDEYRAASIFWVPKEARWSLLKAKAPQPTIGTLVDDAMAAIERDNPSLKGVLPKDFGRAGLDKQRLGQIINLVSDIALGSSADRAKDTLGRVYEYFLSRFASTEGKSGGQFYTPSSVVRVLVEMLAPYKGRVYDPCCGSGGMFVQSEKFVEAYAGTIGDSPFSPPFGKGGQGGMYEDIPGFCKSASLDDIRKHGHVLTPGRYVGAEAVEDDGEPFAEKIKRLTTTLEGQFEESRRLEKEIRKNLKHLGFGKAE